MHITATPDRRLLRRSQSVQNETSTNITQISIEALVEAPRSDRVHAFNDPSKRKRRPTIDHDYNFGLDPNGLIV